MVQSPGIERKLTTILAADAANYSGRMARDEVATVRALRDARAVIDRTITGRGGRIANTSGDGLIAEFPSVVEAVGAAVAIQRVLNTQTDGLPFRLGLHLGDVIVEGQDLLGDGVNLAARLQEVAPEGGIFASRQVVDHARGRLAAEFRPMRPTALKHLPEEVAVFAVLADGVTAPDDLAPVLPGATIPPMSAQKVSPKPRRNKDDYHKARDRLIIASVGTLAMTLFMGPWVLFGFGPLVVTFLLKFRRLHRERLENQ